MLEKIRNEPIPFGPRRGSVDKGIAGSVELNTEVLNEDDILKYVRLVSGVAGKIESYYQSVCSPFKSADIEGIRKTLKAAATHSYTKPGTKST